MEYVEKNVKGKRIKNVAVIITADAPVLLEAKMNDEIRKTLIEQLSSPEIDKKLKELNEKASIKKILFWNDHFVSDVVIGGCIHPLLGVFDPNCAHCRYLRFENKPLTKL